MLFRATGSTSVGCHVRWGSPAAKYTACSPEPLAISSTVPSVGRTRRRTARIESQFVARFVGENNGLPATVLSVTNSVCRVRLENGTEAGATLVDGLAPGDVTLVAIRPERISLGAENTAANGARVIVGNVVYNGDHVLLPCSPGRQSFC